MVKNVVLMIFIVCPNVFVYILSSVKHTDKNFLGISSFDILSSPMRQAFFFFKALLLLTDENT